MSTVMQNVTTTLSSSLNAVSTVARTIDKTAGLAEAEVDNLARHQSIRLAKADAELAQLEASLP